MDLFLPTLTGDRVDTVIAFKTVDMDSNSVVLPNQWYSQFLMLTVHPVALPRQAKGAGQINSGK